MVFQLVQIVYWLALATWFGGALFVAMAAPAVFATVRRHRPILPNVLSVNLNDQHGTLLAGSIVGDLLDRLTRLELICAAAILLALIAQVFLIDLAGRNALAAGLRIGLFLVSVAMVLYHWLVLWPRIIRFREQYIEHADEPEIANPAKEQFDHEHQRSVLLLQVMLFALLGLVLFSANITPRAREILPDGEQGRFNGYVTHDEA